MKDEKSQLTSYTPETVEIPDKLTLAKIALQTTETALEATKKLKEKTEELIQTTTELYQSKRHLLTTDETVKEYQRQLQAICQSNAELIHYIIDHGLFDDFRSYQISHRDEDHISAVQKLSGMIFN